MSAQERRDGAATRPPGLDEQLAGRCRLREDPEAWAELVRRFAPYVHAILGRGYGLPEHEAQDLFQEVFLRAWEHVDELRSDDALRPWIAQLTRRIAVDRLHAAARERAQAELGERDTVPAPELLERLDDALMVREALRRLPTAQQEILRRLFVDGQTHAEIAAALGIAEGTVASRASRARGRLRVQLAVQRRAAGREPGA